MNSARRSPHGKDFITLGYIDYTIAKFEPPINIGYAMSANPILTNITFDSRQFRENYPANTKLCKRLMACSRRSLPLSSMGISRGLWEGRHLMGR